MIEFRCDKYNQGLPLYTQEQQRLFLINGIQLQSGIPCNLLSEVKSLQELNVDVLRISPQEENLGAIIYAFKTAIKNDESNIELDSPEAGWCNGYWHGQPGLEWKEAN